tara:strand:- start:25067 stop:25387 length:321 start_codon:yes stop_codon:yes gene_type:complete
MAGKLEQTADWKTLDIERIRAAVEEIEKSANLRFFITALLNACGVNSTPFDPDPITAARLAGRHSVAMDILSTLSEHSPLLHPRLIHESISEALQRPKEELNAPVY